MKWIVGYQRINQSTAYIDRGWVEVDAPYLEAAADAAHEKIRIGTETIYRPMFRGVTFEIRIIQPRRYRWWSAWFWKWLLDHEGEYGPTNHQ